MGASHTDDPLVAAGELADACRRLSRSVRRVQDAPPDRFEETCRRHCREAGELRARICAAADRLMSRRDGVETDGEALRRRMEETLSSLAEARQTYAAIVRAVSEQIGQTRRRLDDLRRGGQALRGYSRSMRD
jgi:hypothetical protein